MNVGDVIAGTDPRQLAELVVDSLKLEGVEPTGLDVTAPLFAGGLGLDSLDLLELSLAIQQRFGVKLKAEDPQNEHIFASLQSLAEHINRELLRRS